jgi:hypothetical protein
MERSKQTSEQTKMRYDKNYITQKTSGMWTYNINKWRKYILIQNHKQKTNKQTMK